MKEQTLVEYLKEHQFKTVFVVAVAEQFSKRAAVMDIVKNTLGIDALAGEIEFDKTRSLLGQPHYKLLGDVKNIMFTSDLTIGITDDGYPSVIRVGHAFNQPVGRKFMEF